MTDEQINAAIAEAIDADPHWKCARDYCNDLNAMHEAEEVLNIVKWSRYTQLLNSNFQNNDPIMKAICHATARQRAEAFLRTLGKWEEVQA